MKFTFTILKVAGHSLRHLSVGNHPFPKDSPRRMGFPEAHGTSDVLSPSMVQHFDAQGWGGFIKRSSTKWMGVV